jgi:hypothetical protein
VEAVAKDLVAIGHEAANVGPNDSDRQVEAEMKDMTLDGNAAAGILGEVFVSEVTTAVTTCAKCGAVAPVDGLRVYLQAPGAVLRCVTCGAVQARMVRAPDRARLDFQGVQALQVEMPPLA